MTPRNAGGAPRSGSKRALALYALVQNTDGEYLFVRRPADARHFAGRWEPPGGKVEEHESLDGTLIREVEEETGIRIRITGFADAEEIQLPHVCVVRVYMKAEPADVKVTLSDEHDEYGWFAPAQLGELDTVGEVGAIVHGIPEDTRSTAPAGDGCMRRNCWRTKKETGG